MSGLHDLAAAALRTLDPEDAHHLTLRALALGLGPRAPAAARLALRLPGGRFGFQPCQGVAAAAFPSGP